MELIIHAGAILSALIIVAWTLDYDDEQEDKLNDQQSRTQKANARPHG